jgi:predicted O-linked N-acetylglucosamine transferase (SPINDLY family)
MKVDVLIDLCGSSLLSPDWASLGGYNQHARPEIMAARPARVGVSFLGFASSLQAEFVDYIVGDAVAMPPDLIKDQLLEKTVQFMRQRSKF